MSTKKVFYMPQPSIMGVWDDAPEDEFKEDVSVFKFTREEGASEASFSVCETTSAYRAILGGLRRGWTSACCVSVSFAPANAVGVVNVEDGIAAQQEGGKWTVKEKAVIDYPS